METDISRMEAQLRTWLLAIDHLACTVHGVGTRRDYNALVYIDELKALHAMALSKLDEFRAADLEERPPLEAGLENAWRDLEAAMENLRP